MADSTRYTDQDRIEAYLGIADTDIDEIVRAERDIERVATHWLREPDLTDDRVIEWDALTEAAQVLVEQAVAEQLAYRRVMGPEIFLMPAESLAGGTVKPPPKISPEAQKLLVDSGVFSRRVDPIPYSEFVDRFDRVLWEPIG